MNKDVLGKVLLFVNLLLIGVLVFILTEPKRKKAAVIEVKVATFQKDVGYLPFLIAKQKGIFDKYKLKISEEPMDRVMDQVSDVAKGSYNMGVAVPFDIFVFKSKDNSELYRLIYLTEGSMGNPVSAMFAREGISSLKDLKGKRVGYFMESRHRDILESILKENDIPTDSVRFIGLTFSELKNALDENLVDAIVVVEPFRSYYMNVKGMKPIIDGILESNVISPYPYSITFTSIANVQLRKEATVRLVQAINEALKYIKENTEESRKILLSDLGFEEEFAFELPEFKSYLEVNQSTIDNFVKELSRREIILFDVSYPSIILDEKTLR